MQIPLEPGDRVVAAINFRSEVVLIVTERGAVFELHVGVDPATDRIQINRR